MAGVQFRPDDEPAFNTFDLPTICTGGDVPTRPCCDACAEWLFCLKRAPLEMTLPGFDFSDWLPMVSMSADKLLASSGAFSAQFTNSDGENEFNGVYLALPDSRQVVKTECPPRVDRCECDFDISYGAWYGNGVYGWYGWWHGYSWGFSDPADYEYYDWYDVLWDYYGQQWFATHHTLLPRTVQAPAALYGEFKNFYVDAKVDCFLNDEDEPAIRFLVLLRFTWEKPANSCLNCTADDYGIDVCDPAIIDAVEAASGWDTAAGEYHYCVPLLRSALIPLAGLAWEDLTAGVPLETIPPPVWTLVDDLVHPPYWEITGGSYGGAVLPELGPMTTIGWATTTGTFGCNDENTACAPEGTAGTGGAFGSHPTGYNCSGGAEIPTGCSFVGGYVSSSMLCVPKPILVNEGAASIRVAGPKCRPADGCASCVPDPEKPTVTIPAQPTFTVSAGPSCEKTFTPVLPSCLTGVTVYWPWGETSAGATPVTHTILNMDPENPTRHKETITAVFIDDRGCVYCWTEEAECGCCPGVSGSLDIEQLDEDGCDYRLTATVTSTEDCPHAFIEYQKIGSGGCDPDFGDCACNELDPDVPGDHCFPCSGTLVDGGTTTISVTAGDALRYRVWDAVCGCASEWVTIPLYCTDCNCCLGKIVTMRVTVAGVANEDGDPCTNCDNYNRTYDLAPFGVTEETCTWSVTVEDLVSCPPSSIDAQLFFSFSCSEFGGNPAINDASIAGSMSGAGGVSGEKTIYDVGTPFVCDDLSGGLTITSTANSGCDYDGATLAIEIITTGA